MKLSLFPALAIAAASRVIATTCAITDASGTIESSGIADWDGKYDTHNYDFWYSRPSPGTQTGVLRLANISGHRRIICVAGPRTNDQCFWINAGDECTVRLGFTRVSSYSMYSA
ncbi:hypothetical protein FOTG_19220 [Fusarium oxysporum f. sp. vasinfectum 25433]|uniref:Uncharacterized protein n=1 Tax=Fusarium oxysporum f. sp. vasinfectum 25433 TaxID=1089449 RepID=X0KFA7_FUSOX|nr:hypothetical protein FOTG_19220 [Fusarium oxysporum f. sp. vasinfectum 25433]